MLLLKLVLKCKSVSLYGWVSIGIKIGKIHINRVVPIGFTKNKRIGNAAAFIQKEFKANIGIKAFIFSLVIPYFILKAQGIAVTVKVLLIE